VNVSSLYTHLIYFCPLDDGKRERERETETETRNGKKRKVDERRDQS
jgi:hypothetical protein